MNSGKLGAKNIGVLKIEEYDMGNLDDQDFFSCECFSLQGGKDCNPLINPNAILVERFPQMRVFELPTELPFVLP